MGEKRPYAFFSHVTKPDTFDGDTWSFPMNPVKGSSFLKLSILNTQETKELSAFIQKNTNNPPTEKKTVKPPVTEQKNAPYKLEDVIIQIFPPRPFWTRQTCKDNPHTLFVFGDNDIQRGEGGQACIRQEPNSVGIPTKKTPGSKKQEDEYYNDKEYTANKVKIDRAFVALEKKLTAGKYKVLMLSSGPLGSGLSELPKRAPITNTYLQAKVKSMYDTRNGNRYIPINKRK
jgi:hypothetical protein